MSLKPQRPKVKNKYVTIKKYIYAKEKRRKTLSMSILIFLGTRVSFLYVLYIIQARI